MRTNLLGCMVLAVVLTTTAFADEANPKKKKGQGDQARATVAAMLMKQLEPCKLTEEQVAQIKEMAKKADAQIMEIRDEAGLNMEVMKKRAEAEKSLKDSDKKGKERMAAVNEAAGLTEDQIAAFGKIGEVRTQFTKSVIAMLTDDQKALLPERMTREPKAEQGKKKGKKKGAA